MFWARKARFLVVHDAPLAALSVPLTHPVNSGSDGGRSNGVIGGGIGGSAEDGSAAHGCVAGGGLVGSCWDPGVAAASTFLGLFADARVYESRHCRGPATMVATMHPGCSVAQPGDIYGYLPPGEQLEQAHEICAPGLRTGILQGA
jgi:hypothetical protein